jgi:dienelactone hydrolase
MEADSGFQPAAPACAAHLENVPWVDHTRVAAFGFRFGANVAVRLAIWSRSA